MAAFPISIAGVVPSDQLVLSSAVAAYPGRYCGQTRLHTNSDLRIFLRWCEAQDLEPLATVRADIERYVRWLPSSTPYRLTARPPSARLCLGRWRSGWVCLPARSQSAPAGGIAWPSLTLEVQWTRHW
jgi:hypothetical protein